jgi:hypothetical protein
MLSSNSRQLRANVGRTESNSLQTSENKKHWKTLKELDAFEARLGADTSNLNLDCKNDT